MPITPPGVRTVVPAGTAWAQRILREANSWIELGLHPNIAYCYYVRNIEDVPHIFVEYVDGGNLRQWIEEDMKTKYWRGVVLVNVTNHYVVAHRGLVADNHWKEPVPPVVHHAGRKRVEQAWLITKI